MLFCKPGFCVHKTKTLPIFLRVVFHMPCKDTGNGAYVKTLFLILFPAFSGGQRPDPTQYTPHAYLCNICILWARVSSWLICLDCRVFLVKALFLVCQCLYNWPSLLLDVYAQQKPIGLGCYHWVEDCTERFRYTSNWTYIHLPKDHVYWEIYLAPLDYASRAHNIKIRPFVHASVSQ